MNIQKLELTEFETTYLPTVWDKYISDLEITFDKDKQVCRTVKAKVTGHSKLLERAMVPSKRDPSLMTLSFSELDTCLATRLIHFLHMRKYDRVGEMTWAKTHVHMYNIGVLYRIEDLKSYTRKKLLRLWRLDNPAKRLKNCRRSKAKVRRSLAKDVSRKFEALCDCIPKIYECPGHHRHCPISELMDGVFSLFWVMTPAQREFLNNLTRKFPQFGLDLQTAE